MSSVAGKHLLVVGASSGIGRAVAVNAARAGASVSIAARRIAECREAAQEAGANAVAIECDVRDAAACQRVVDETVAAFGTLDAVVYATGATPLGWLADAGSDEWRMVLETNLVGAALVTRFALPHLKLTNGRAIYLSSSSVGAPYPALALYASSKAGLEEMVRGWRGEHSDVDFACVVVGPTAPTGFGHDWDPARALEMLAYWADHGYDAAANPTDVDDAANAVVDVVAAPVCPEIVRLYQHVDLPSRKVGNPGP